MQLAPKYPAVHEQVYPSEEPSGVHVAPFWHGVGLHFDPFKFIGEKKETIVNVFKIKGNEYYQT